MVIRDGADRVEEVQIVLVRRVVSSPADDVVGTKLAFTLKHFSNMFVIDMPFFFFVVVPGRRVLEILRVSESVGSDRTEFRQSKVMTECFSDPSFDLSLYVYCELYASWDHQDLSGFDCQTAVQGLDVESADVRDDQELTVRVVKG